MKTLKENYKKNIEILIENIKRGMNLKQVNQIIDSQEKQFINNGLYNKSEKDYISEMKKIRDNNFIKATKLATQMGMEVTQLEIS